MSFKVYSSLLIVSISTFSSLLSAIRFIKSSFSDNIIGLDFYGNTLEPYIWGLVIDNSFKNNKLKFYSAGSFIGYNSHDNDFCVFYATIGDNFRSNICDNSIRLMGDLTSATHIYGGYTCTIFINSMGATKLSYVDGSGNTVVVGVNA